VFIVLKPVFLSCEINPNAIDCRNEKAKTKQNRSQQEPHAKQQHHHGVDPSETRGEDQRCTMESNASKQS
jgi:hypothetical protein